MYASGLALPVRLSSNGVPARVSGADYVRQSARLLVERRSTNPFLSPRLDLEDYVFGVGGGVETAVRRALDPLDAVELARVEWVDVARVGPRLVVEVDLRLVESGDRERLRVEVEP